MKFAMKAVPALFRSGDSKWSETRSGLQAAVVALTQPAYRGLVRYMAKVGLALHALPLEIPDKGALEKLPEGQRSLYVEKDGKYRLEVEGIEDTSGLKSSLEQERSARRAAEKKMKDFAKQFEGIDPEKVRAFMGQFEDAEEAELLKQGAAGIDKIVERRMAKQKEAYENQLQQLQESYEGSLEVAGSYMDRVLDSHVTQAAVKAGVHPNALEDVLLRARMIFSVDDEGNPVQFEGGEGDDEEERVVMGKDGKTPFNPGEWIEGMKEKAPHWFQANSSGGGAPGNRGSSHPGGKTIRRASWETLSQEERHAKVKEGFKVVD